MFSVFSKSLARKGDDLSASPPFKKRRATPSPEKSNISMIFKKFGLVFCFSSFLAYNCDCGSTCCDESIGWWCCCCPSLLVLLSNGGGGWARSTCSGRCRWSCAWQPARPPLAAHGTRTCTGQKKTISILYLYIKEQPNDALKSTKNHKNSKKGVLLKQKLHTVEKILRYGINWTRTFFHPPKTIITIKKRTQAKIKVRNFV